MNSQGINKVIGEGKRFMAYEIIKRLKALGKNDLLYQLEAGVQHNEKAKGKIHQIFRLSFDAKLLTGEEEILQVMDYIHHNPVSGKWALAPDYLSYPYSSASYYEQEKQGMINLYDFRDRYSEFSSSDSEGSKNNSNKFV